MCLLVSICRFKPNHAPLKYRCEIKKTELGPPYLQNLLVLQYGTKSSHCSVHQIFISGAPWINVPTQEKSSTRKFH